MTKLTMTILLKVFCQFISMNSADATWVEVPLSNMDITQGREDARQLASGLSEITGSRFRATERGRKTYGARLVFAFLGEAVGGEALQGGDYRIQFGLKMLSANPCNLLYVMWRLYPVEAIVVSTKRHSGTTSAECGNQGYRNVVPDVLPAGAGSASVPVPPELSARGGQTRSLMAYYNRRTQVLKVSIQGRPVWEGRLPWIYVRRLEGQSGVRSDNGMFRFRFSTY